MTWQSPTKPWALCSPKRQAQLRTAWGAGNLRWKLDPSQQQIYDAIYASHPTVKSAAERIFCLDVSRQSGKDFLMSVLAIEQCLRNRRQIRIPYACPTKDTVHELLVPTMFQVFQDCPDELLPHEIAKGTFRTNAHSLSWDWGARIVLIGVDLHPDWLRGPATEVCMMTEPAFIEELEGLMSGVILPQFLTYPQGWMVMASTPPVTPGHAWTQKYIPAAKSRGMYAKRVITDCPRFDADQVKGFIQELGGPKSTRVRRELFCEHIIESSLAAVPEFTPELKADVVTEEGFWPAPPYRDTYVALDPGFSHATGGVWAWYDFDHDRVMVEGDCCPVGANSRTVAQIVKAREWQLWGRLPTKDPRMTDDAWKVELEMIRSHFYRDLPCLSSPVKTTQDGRERLTTFRRVSDTDSRLIADMANEHGIQISPTDKDESEAALNAFRVKLEHRKYRIHPRCVSLISHLEQATWNKSRTKLAESADGTHFDCLPAMVYLNRNMVWGRNPSPPVRYDRNTHFIPAGSRPMSKTAAALRTIFGQRRR